MISSSISSFSRRRGATVAGMFGVALSSVLLLCGAGSVPIENLLPQGAMQGDLNAGGHSLTNAATVSAANVSATNSLVVPTSFFSTNNVVQTTGSYANPSWLTSLGWSKLTGTSTNVPTPMTTLGDLMYGGTSGVNTRLAGSTSSGMAFLTQTGTGSASAAPVWKSGGTLNLSNFNLQNVNLVGSSNENVLNGHYLYDSSSNTAVEFSNRYLDDTSSTPAIDWGNRFLKDSSYVTAIDWQNRRFDNTSGTALNGIIKGQTSGPWTTAVAGTDYPGLATANTFSATQTITGGELAVDTAGHGLQVKEGSNAKQGVATLAAGTVTVGDTSVTANSRIFLTTQSLGTVTVPKAVAVTARTAGTSFTITSADTTDTSVVAYEIFEPAP